MKHGSLSLILSLNVLYLGVARKEKKVRGGGIRRRGNEEESRKDYQHCGTERKGHSGRKGRLHCGQEGQGDPSKNEERAGKRGGGRKEKRRTRLKRKGRKDRTKKKYNWLKKAEFRVSGTEKRLSRD